MNKCVTCEFILAGIRFTTHNALERPLTSVDARMNNKTLIPKETLATGLTTEREVVSVDPHVVLKFIFSAQHFATVLTHKGTLACMDKRMSSQLVFTRVRFAAHAANVGPFTGVYPGVYHETLVPKETLAARGAVVREVVGVDAHVDLEFIPACQHLPAQITLLLLVPALTCQGQNVAPVKIPTFSF